MPHITNRRYGSKFSHAKSRWQASTCIRKQDNFGKEVPNFNIGGETQINTVVGGFLSIMVLGMTLFYGIVKFIDLYQGNDPNIRTTPISENYGPDDYLTFSDDLSFRLAVGTKVKGEQKLFQFNPKEIKWIALMTSRDDKGATSKTILPLYDCKEDDFENFYPL